MKHSTESASEEWFGVGPSVHAHCRYVFEFFFFNYGSNRDRLEVVTHRTGAPADQMNRIFAADNMRGGMHNALLPINDLYLSCTWCTCTCHTTAAGT